MSEAEQIKTVKKLHRQFRHQSEKVTEELMRRAGVLTKECLFLLHQQLLS